jgi:hypothetical protein
MVKEQCPDVTEEWLQSVVLAVNEEYVEPGEKVRSDIAAAPSVPKHASMTLLYVLPACVPLPRRWI